ncbi:MAG: SGNH/GDSL hydrolase family protein [Verrucomicrobiia bacterium]
MSKPPFLPGQTILFQGDSITDGGRDRSDPLSRGHGYVFFVSSMLEARFPECGWVFLNRGISGDRVVDLAARWQEDCIDLNPSWVSLLIGINDCCRRFDANMETTVEEYENCYREILQRTVAETQARLILCEPFLIPYPPEVEGWRVDLDPKIQAVRRLAREFKALLVPFDGAFASAATRREPKFWAHDGVHPSAAGHALMADVWLRTVNGG